MTKQFLLSLLNCSWQWMLLSGLIWFATSSLFRKNPRSNTTVHLLWLLSLLSLPILFGLNQFVPALSIGGNPVPELVQAKPIDVSGLAALTTDLPEISSTENYTQSKNQLLAGSAFFLNWVKTDLLLCVWAIGALTMLVRFMFGLYRIHQFRRSAVAADASYQAICQHLARQLSIKRSVTVCFSDRVTSPVSFGWLSPYILIPRELNLEQFELVTAHELAHVQRLDWLTNLFSHFVGAIFFFHPIYHLLNRELVRVRERICDDWVIRLTGARKNYAQCLLDLVRHEDRVVPLALSLNQPSQLESRIDSILKSNRRLDVQLKPRLQLITATLLLTCLPLLAMAQLVPLKTVQVSLFAQTPEKSEKSVDKTQEKQEMEKAKTGKMDGKKVKVVIVKENDDTSGDAHEWLELRNLSDNELNLKGWTLDLTKLDTLDTEGKLIRFNKDVKVPVDSVIIIEKNDDASDDTPEWLELRNLSDNELNLKGWTLGLATTELDTVGKLTPTLFFNKDVKIPAGEVLRVIYPESLEKLGVIVTEYKYPDKGKKEQGETTEKMEDISDQTEELLKQLNTFQERLQRINETVAKTKGKEDRLDQVEALLEQLNANLKILQREKKSIFAAKTKGKEDRLDQVEALVKQLNANLEVLRDLNERATAAKRESQNRYRTENVEVKAPAEFKKVQGATLFSGPQPGEKLPPLMVKGINGDVKDKTYDVIAKADGQPLVLFLQDESGLGLRGLVGISRLLAQIIDKSKQAMLMSAVFLGDTPDTVENQASKLGPHIPSGVLLGVSQDGREGPGSYGLNRNVAQTVIIAKDGKVLHNFAFAQPMLRPDPYVLGAIGEAIGIKPATLEKWLNEKPTENERMQRGDASEEARAFGKQLLEMVEKGEITAEEARERYEKAFPRRKED